MNKRLDLCSAVSSYLKRVEGLQKVKKLKLYQGILKKKYLRRTKAIHILTYIIGVSGWILEKVGKHGKVPFE